MVVLPVHLITLESGTPALSRAGNPSCSPRSSLVVLPKPSLCAPPWIRGEFTDIVTLKISIIDNKVDE
ncbi:hypothetical protein SESBI_23389 [Sesbania bispinosa]|nr:hypothetical protein SESBI_23389 [Sesbania bispinosa]